MNEKFALRKTRWSTVAALSGKRRTAIFAKDATYFLERAILFAFCVHGIAMLAMLGFLLAGLPGGPHAGAARMAYVASYPWLWRLGWFSWQLTALSDLLISLALLRIRWRLAALVAVLLTVAAIVPDQMGQVLWMTRGVTLAQQGSLALYAPFEATVFSWIGIYGGAGYTLAAVAWTWCLTTQSDWRWPRAFIVFSSLLWLLFAGLSVNPLLPMHLHLSPLEIAGGNALGFVLLLTWMALVGEVVLRHTRPDQAVGRSAPWRSPYTAQRGRVVDLVANSRFLRTLCEYVPVVAFRSEITEVCYVNYLVEASKLTALVPEGLELQRLGDDGNSALFSFLTFRQGHCGPRWLGKWRRFCPSPMQTNWRIYVRDPRSGKQGIYFVSTACDNLLVALGARLFCEGMPMHLLHAGSIAGDKAGQISLYLASGTGSAPDAQANLQVVNQRPAQGPWSRCFASYEAMLAYCVPQDRAFSSQPWYARVTRQEIALDIPLASCQPLAGDVYSQTARQFVGDATPFCFSVAEVNFRFEGESYSPLA
jgi:hypothetical protein